MTYADDLKAIADTIGPKTIETPDIKTTEHDLNTLDRLNQKSKNVSPMFHTFSSSVAVPIGFRCVHGCNNTDNDC